MLSIHNPDGTVTCSACRRYCRLKEGQHGFCGIRMNQGGNIALLTYGLPLGMHIDPIEKKPVLHKFPNYRVLSFGTAGCNYACRYCQNWEMSQHREPDGEKMSPEEVVDLAIRTGCQGIAYTYNEPTVFIEFAHDVGVLARKKGLVNIFVTNGYETEESLELCRDFLDMMTVDFKGNASNQFYRKYISVMGADPIFDTISSAKEKGIYVEMTDLVVPEVGDSIDDARSMLARLMDILGDSFPMSFLKFHPDYKMMEYGDTPLETLVRHFDLAREMGIKYAYVGNVFETDLENTYCPSCGTLLIERSGFCTSAVSLLENGVCPSCQQDTGIRLHRRN
ncbi:MAG: AmmeMemoRadiSam system radical SAM enzyme [Candidatus Thermoplasmatota archaeon]|jgi:pyruvate formate lyase activating enzyme|nr:AmmeMemoRadiSam system radical SAM enzyme [Candidatus Thermoplasmatota archaeon]